MLGYRGLPVLVTVLAVLMAALAGSLFLAAKPAEAAFPGNSRVLLVATMFFVVEMENVTRGLAEEPARRAVEFLRSIIPNRDFVNWPQTAMSSANDCDFGTGRTSSSFRSFRKGERWAWWVL